MINYVIAIVKDDDMGNYGAVVPDVDGCLPFGDTIDETIANAKALLNDHIATTIELGLPFEFKTTPIETLQQDPDYQDVLAWAFVSIDETAFDKQVRFNVSWSEQLLKVVDEYVAKTHDTRSGFLAKLAKEKLAKETLA